MNARSLYAFSSIAAVLDFCRLARATRRLRPHARRRPAPTSGRSAPPPPPPTTAALTNTGADMASARDAARASLTAPIYFDLGTDALTDADRAWLDAKVGILYASRA